MLFECGATGNLSRTEETSRQQTFYGKEKKMKNVTIIAAVIAALAFGLTSRTLATTVVYQEGVSGGAYDTCDDTWIDSAGPDTGYGQSTTLRVRHHDTLGDRHALIAFRDIVGWNEGQITPNYIVHSAKLKLHWTNETGGVVNLYMLQRDWSNGGEGTENGSPVDNPGELDTTWNKATDFYTGEGTDVSWSTAGGLGTGDIITPYILQTSGGNVGGWLILDITSAVQEWVNGTSNFGLIMAHVDPEAPNWMFDSSESSTLSYHPILEVQFAPEPGVAMLLGLAGLAILRRRRIDN
jgi:hypothetical protein